MTSSAAQLKSDHRAEIQSIISMCLNAHCRVKFMCAGKVGGKLDKNENTGGAAMNHGQMVLLQ